MRVLASGVFMMVLLVTSLCQATSIPIATFTAGGTGVYFLNCTVKSFELPSDTVSQNTFWDFAGATPYGYKTSLSTGVRLDIPGAASSYGANISGNYFPIDAGVASSQSSPPESYSYTTDIYIDDSYQGWQNQDSIKGVQINESISSLNNWYIDRGDTPYQFYLGKIFNPPSEGLDVRTETLLNIVVGAQ